jgi:hypothetical protein
VPASPGSEPDTAKREDDERALKLAIDKLGLPPDAADYLNGRYLPYTRFCETQATKWRVGYYWLRIPAITLAAFVPALVAANLGLAGRLIATGLGVVIAALSAVEHFLNAGGRWRHYRGTVERLKSEGWAYLALASPYTGATDHPSALPSFVDQIERLIRSDVGDYVALVDTEAPTARAA